MMIQAVLGNPKHPEYGVATIPFPIPHDQYAHCMELLEALEIGDAVKADCKVTKIDSFYTVLKRTEMLTVNVEELNYLAKRLDSFDIGEAAQFQAMAHKLELFDLKDLINLSFCCQQATVITDFSDLAAIGRDHYMNLHGGSASVDELNALDGEELAQRLIESGSGTITPYGVVYDNGMKLLLYAASREPRRGETPVTRASAVPAAALAWGSSVEYRQQRKSKKAAPQGAVPPRYGAASSALRQKYGDRPPPLSLFHHPFSSFFQSSERPAFTPPYPPDDPHICAARYDSKNRRALP